MRKLKYLRSIINKEEFRTEIMPRAVQTTAAVAKKLEKQEHLPKIKD